MFEKFKNELDNYEKLLKNKPDTYEGIYRNKYAIFDVAKAFIFDCGYEDAEKFAKAILALVELK